MKKLTSKIISRITSLLQKIRMFLILSKVQHFRNEKRFKTNQIKFFGFTIYTNDPFAFYFEFIYIFKNKIYDFSTTKTKPFIIDGGGYIGTSVLFFKKKYPDSEILVFEPDKTALPLLHKNIAENGLKNVRVVETGLYSFDGTVDFNPDNTDGGKIAEKGNIKIPVKKLSEYIDKDVDFLKLNIEGSEFAVFQDLDKSRKMEKIKELCFEWHSFIGQEQNLGNILNILTNNGFRYYISNFEGASLGNFSGMEENTFYLLVYAKR